MFYPIATNRTIEKLNKRYQKVAIEEWQNWNSYNIAIASCAEEQFKCWQSFEYYRKLLHGHETFPHMKVWEEMLNTSEDSRYLRGIGGKDTLILAPRESAKAVAVDTFIATPQGWKQIKDVHIDSYVYDELGIKTKVIGVGNFPNQTAWKVTFSDQTSIICNDEHLWKIRRMGSDNKGQWRVMNLWEIRTQKTVGSSGNWRSGVKRVTETAQKHEKPWLDSRGYSRYQIPVCNAVQYSPKKLNIHPYLMGVLLGDGHMFDCCITTGDEELFSIVSKFIGDWGISKKEYSYKKNTWTLRITKDNAKFTIRQCVKELNLQDKLSYDKFIPNIYLQGSVAQRTELLQGLLDTDGCYSANKNAITYSSTSKKIIDGIIQLVRSLGGIATCSKPKTPKFTSKGQKKEGRGYWLLHIKLPETIKPFKLKRRIEKYKPATKYFPVRSIVDIEQVENCDMKCIAVDSPKKTFITDSYIVTHNSSYLGQWIAYQLGHHVAPWNKIPLKILGVSYDLTTAAQRSRQVRAIIRSPQYQAIFPWVRPSKSKWNEREWSIDFDWAGLSTTEEQYTYVCAGISGAINSRRCHIALLDDLIKSPDQIKAHSVRELMISNWKNVIQYTMYDGARAVCLGTLMSPNDIYTSTFTEIKGWIVRRQRALLEDKFGNEYSYWEPKDEFSPGTPLTRLQSERSEKPESFSLQRQNELIEISETSIDIANIVQSPIPMRLDSLVMGVDLSAGTKESNDYTAFVLGGFADDRFWIIDVWEDRTMGNVAKLDAIVEIWNLWKDRLPQNVEYVNGEYIDVPRYGLNIYFDKSAYGLSFEGDYKDHIENTLKIRNWKCVGISSSHRGSKLERLRKHSSVFEKKQIRFNPYSRRMDDGREPLGRLIEQITKFGRTSHDDLADALELCLTGLRSRTREMSKGNY